MGLVSKAGDRAFVKGGASPLGSSGGGLLAPWRTDKSADRIASPIKWAGGKRWLMTHLFDIFPRSFNCYVEPFAGGASVFFALRPDCAVLSDLNGELVTTYTSIRDDPEKVWSLLAKHADSHSDDYFYSIRAKRFLDPFAVAARFLYLNRTCWNGLFRVNLRGEFNVPRGTKNTVLLPNDNPYMVSACLKRAEILWCDFEMAIDSTNTGDLIYADPPYTVKHNYNGFVKYNEAIFTWNDQERLADALGRAVKRGVHVVLSNADHVSIRELYGDQFSLYRVGRRSVIAGSSAFRNATTELLIVGAPNASK